MKFFENKEFIGLHKQRETHGYSSCDLAYNNHERHNDLSMNCCAKNHLAPNENFSLDQTTKFVHLAACYASSCASDQHTIPKHFHAYRISQKR